MSTRRSPRPRWPTVDARDAPWPEPGPPGSVPGPWPSRAATEGMDDRTGSSDGSPFLGRVALVGLTSRRRKPVVGHEVERGSKARPVARLDVVPGHQDHLLSRGKLSGRSLVRVAVRGHDHVIALGRIVEEALDPVELLVRGGRVVPDDGRAVLQ